MKKKKRLTLPRPVKIALSVAGTVILLFGLMISLNILSKLPFGSGFASFARLAEGLSSWAKAAIMLGGLVMIALVLNTIDTRADGNTLNSRLLRRPIQRLFPVFLLPTFAAFCLGFLYPFLKGLFLSFAKFQTTKEWDWVGIQNYLTALNDPTFMHAFWYTALFAIASLIIINVLAFAVAYALTRGIKGSNLFRTVFFMPNLIGGIVLGYIWSMIFDGILIHFGTAVKLETAFGFWGLIILMAWQQIGYMMIIYIAGIQSVPEDIVEAAKIDGASSWKTLWHVTIPNIMPSITICTFLTLTNSFKLFDQNLALTEGRPFVDGVKTTEMLALNIYSSFYENLKSRGPGQAKAVIFFILVAVISIVQLRSTKKKEVQQ